VYDPDGEKIAHYDVLFELTVNRGRERKKKGVCSPTRSVLLLLRVAHARRSIDGPH